MWIDLKDGYTVVSRRGLVAITAIAALAATAATANVAMQGIAQLQVSKLNARVTLIEERQQQLSLQPQQHHLQQPQP